MNSRVQICQQLKWQIDSYVNISRKKYASGIKLREDLRDQRDFEFTDACVVM